MGGNSLPELCIRRPVLAVVMSLLLVLLGLIAFDRLSVREYPNIDPPIVLVSTNYTGASAEILESQVTRVLEESLAGIEGIDYIRSVSRQELSQIAINFHLTRDIDAAVNDVRDRVGRARDRLPREIDEPLVQRLEADAEPIMGNSLSSDRHSPMELTEYAELYVKDRLQALPGVAEVRIFGARRFSMRIWLDPARLAAYNLTVQDVENALRAQNVEIPSGRIESAEQEFSVLSQTDMREPAEFEAVVLKQADIYPVRIRDVGRVELAPDEERSIVRFNGRPSIGLGIVKQSTGNPLEISRAVRTEIDKINLTLPEGMQLRVGYDTSIFIERSIAAVYWTILESVLLVGLVVLLFLRTPRATFIPLVTIPASLIAAFALMAAAGFTVNTLTLLAMVLAVGLVVDDAIVMLENIFRHIEEGVPPMQAAMQGSREIGFAIIAMTITLATVYAPIGFLTGRSGRLFIEFAWTLAGTVLISGFIALTLTPMMCSRLLRHEEKHGAIYTGIENAIVSATNAYQRVLGQILSRRLMVMGVAAIFVVAGGVLFATLKNELTPVEDRSSIVGVYIAPEGATIDYMDRFGAETDEIYRTTPEIKSFFMVLGNPIINNGNTYLNLLEWDERERSQQDIVKELSGRLGKLTGFMAFPMNRPSLGQSPLSRPLWIVLKSTDSYVEIERITQKVLGELRKYPGFVNIDTNLKLNKPELKVTVNRDKVQDAGVEVATVGRTLETMLGGRDVTRFKREGKQYDVVVQMEDVDRVNPDDLARIYVRGRDGGMIQLSNLVDVQESVAPRELVRFDQMHSSEINATLAPGYTLGEALDHLERVARENIPSSMQIDFISQSREYRSASTEIYFIFLLALVFIYLVLSAQFESFIDPIVILLTVPLSMTGALLALKLSGGTLNIYSQIGLVTLVGLITKHGILIVDFSNKMRAEGKSIREAVIEAAALRLRPILMTSGAMIMGAVPLCLASGAGAESRQAIGWVIVGGISLGTVLTLFILPTVYTIISRFRTIKPAPLGLAGAAAAE
ncbi:MAG TPA: efflux RND transporter permease subunit [Alphaproteobacteria bacterium]|nr:efflux RND transporter permease subunit [Alphaproteobacteria bacterium]